MRIDHPNPPLRHAKMGPQLWNHTTPHRILAVWFFFALSACAAPTDGPRDTLHDADVPMDQRIAALQQLVVTQPQQDWRPVVDELAFRGRAGDAFALRQAAMTLWADHDPAGLDRRLDRGLMQLQHWEMIEHALSLIETNNWQQLTPAVIQSYARESQRYPDTQRPERQTLAVLRPGADPFDAAWPVCVDSDQRFSTRRRVAAWSLMMRLDPDQASRMLENRLPDTPTSDPLLDALRSAHTELGILPRNREQVLWVMRLRQPDHALVWDSARHHRVSKSSGNDRFKLRHIVLVSDGPVGSSMPTPVPTNGSSPRRAGLTSGRGTDASAVTRWDQRLIAAIADALQWPSVRRDLFTQADADRRDDTTEHGGVLVMGDEQPVAVAVEPVIRRHDQAYYTPQRAMELMYTGLAHYHFHAQKHDNAEYAGPGAGDLTFADNTGAACVVLTFIDRDTLNADFYTEGGIVVDLGHLQRP